MDRHFYVYSLFFIFAAQAGIHEFKGAGAAHDRPDGELKF
jgi:hypothetical protein